MGLTVIIATSMAVYAFTPAKKAKSDSQWFEYNASLGPVNNANSYEAIPGVPSCNGDGSVCAILAQPDENGKPDLNTVEQVRGKE